MLKNNLDILKKIKKKIEKIDINIFIQRIKKENIQGQLKVANKEYCNWLEFLNNLCEPFDSECWLYKTLKHKTDFTKQDEENIIKLDYFYSFLHTVADTQGIKEYHNNNDICEEYKYIFKYNNQYYQWNILIGQGSVTIIQKIQQPSFSFIDLDIYFKNK